MFSRCLVACFFFFFFNDTATTEIYTLSLHDALPIFHSEVRDERRRNRHGAVGLLSRLEERREGAWQRHPRRVERMRRSEEHTSELQSLAYLVCRLLLEKKKNCGKQKSCGPAKVNVRD